MTHEHERNEPTPHERLLFSAGLVAKVINHPDEASPKYVKTVVQSFGSLRELDEKTWSTLTTLLSDYAQFRAAISSNFEPAINATVTRDALEKLRDSNDTHEQAKPSTSTPTEIFAQAVYTTLESIPQEIGDAHRRARGLEFSRERELAKVRQELDDYKKNLPLDKEKETQIDNLEHINRVHEEEIYRLLDDNAQTIILLTDLIDNPKTGNSSEREKIRTLIARLQKKRWEVMVKDSEEKRQGLRTAPPSPQDLLSLDLDELSSEDLEYQIDEVKDCLDTCNEEEKPEYEKALRKIEGEFLARLTLGNALSRESREKIRIRHPHKGTIRTFVNDITVKPKILKEGEELAIPSYPVIPFTDLRPTIRTGVFLSHYTTADNETLLDLTVQRRATEARYIIQQDPETTVDTSIIEAIDRNISARVRGTKQRYLQITIQKDPEKGNPDNPEGITYLVRFVRPIYKDATAFLPASVEDTNPKKKGWPDDELYPTQEDPDFSI